MAYTREDCMQDDFPKEVFYFKEEVVCEILSIPPQKLDMEKIVDIMVWAEVQSIKLGQTKKGRSFEGQYSSGYKLIIELNLKEKVTYVAQEPTQSVHAAYYESLKGMFVVIPEEVDGKNVYDLLRAKRFVITPYIEDISVRRLSTREIFNCIMLFIDVKVC